MSFVINRYALKKYRNKDSVECLKQDCKWKSSCLNKTAIQHTSERGFPSK